jgi:Zn-dependent alcohol dehydrogenase
MRAAVLREPGDVRVEVVELDPPHAGEVLVRVAVAGVCYADVTFADGGLGSGRWPAVLGHDRDECRSLPLRLLHKGLSEKFQRARGSA